MNLTPTEHAIITRLRRGPANYIQLGMAAGISDDGARKAFHKLAELRPVIVTYYHDGRGRNDTLMLTEAGREIDLDSITPKPRCGGRGNRR